MSQDPNEILSDLAKAASAKEPATIYPYAAAWLLAHISHQAERIEALNKLVAKKTLPAPGETVCQEADRIVSHDRQETYGHPIHDFTRTARHWEVILDLPAGKIHPAEVGLCMIAVKLSRETHRHKRDNLVDICGYAKTVDLIEGFTSPTP